MSTYTIRPTAKGFGVFGGRGWFGRTKMIEEHERLYDAEMHALHLVTREYHKLLDYDRLTNQTMSTDMMNPRVNEEHVYTALVLAGKKPTSADDEQEFLRARGQINGESSPDFDKILEQVLGKPITMVARVMFEERFMTWYGQQPANVDWVDPRREREYDVQRDMPGRNRYRSSVAGVATTKISSPKISSPGLMARAARALRAAVFRNYGREDTRGLTDAAASNPVQGR